MKFKIISRVTMFGMNVEHEHIQQFDDNSNVFGRALEYRQYMRREFPNMNFELVQATEIEE